MAREQWRLVYNLRIFVCTVPYAQRNTGEQQFSPVHVYLKINTDFVNFVQKCEGYPIKRQYTHKEGNSNDIVKAFFK